MADELELDLRLGHMRRAMASQPRLTRNLRQLGAVGALVPPPPPGSRQAIIKVWVARPSTTGQHLRYLQRGKGLDGQDAQLFGAQDVARLRQEAQQDPHQFRMAIAPLGVTLALFVPLLGDLMRRVERDLSRPLDWVGAIHQDTSNLHAHVLLRGRDLSGKDLYIAKPYVTQGLRDRVRELATWYFGKEIPTERTQATGREIAREVAREQRQDRGIER